MVQPKIDILFMPATRRIGRTVRWEAGMARTRGDSRLAQWRRWPAVAGLIAALPLTDALAAPAAARSPARPQAPAAAAGRLASAPAGPARGPVVATQDGKLPIAVRGPGRSCHRFQRPDPCPCSRRYATGTAAPGPGRDWLPIWHPAG